MATAKNGGSESPTKTTGKDLIRELEQELSAVKASLKGFEQKEAPAKAAAPAAKKKNTPSAAAKGKKADEVISETRNFLEQYSEYYAMHSEKERAKRSEAMNQLIQDTHTFLADFRKSFDAASKRAQEERRVFMLNLRKNGMAERLARLKAMEQLRAELDQTLGAFQAKLAADNQQRIRGKRKK